MELPFQQKIELKKKGAELRYKPTYNLLKDISIDNEDFLREENYNIPFKSKMLNDQIFPPMKHPENLYAESNLIIGILTGEFAKKAKIGLPLETEKQNIVIEDAETQFSMMDTHKQKISQMKNIVNLFVAGILSGIPNLRICFITLYFDF